MKVVHHYQNESGHPNFVPLNDQTKRAYELLMDIVSQPKTEVVDNVQFNATSKDC